MYRFDFGLWKPALLASSVLGFPIENSKDRLAIAFSQLDPRYLWRGCPDPIKPFLRPFISGDETSRNAAIAAMPPQVADVTAELLMRQYERVMNDAGCRQ